MFEMFCTIQLDTKLEIYKLLHEIVKEYFLETFCSEVPFLPEQFRFYSLDNRDNAKTITKLKEHEHECSSQISTFQKY